VAQPLTNFLSKMLGELPAPAQGVVAAARASRLAGGDTLLRAGDRWTSAFWVESGVLRLYYLDREGASANKNFFLDGALLWPLTPTLSGQPVDFWIEALTTAAVWSLPMPQWQEACTGWAAWQVLERQTLAALLDDKMRREQQFLQCSATQRYQNLCARRPEWLTRVPLRHLASYLGVTDVALSRIRRRLNPG
jgi:CRP-like cAMP-binding protein